MTGFGLHSKDTPPFQLTSLRCYDLRPSCNHGGTPGSPARSVAQPEWPEWFVHRGSSSKSKAVGFGRASARSVPPAAVHKSGSVLGADISEHMLMLLSIVAVQARLQTLKPKSSEQAEYALGPLVAGLWEARRSLRRGSPSRTTSRLSAFLSGRMRQRCPAVK